MFLKEARKYGVLPMDDRVFERLDGAAVGRPDLMGGRTSITLAEGMTGMMESVFPNVKNRSKTLTAEIEMPASGGNGTLIAQGGRFGGWSLYVKDGVPAYDYNFLGLQRTSITSTKKLPAGKAEVRFQFDYDGGGPAKGGQGTLFVNGEKVAEGRIPPRSLEYSRPTRPPTWVSTSARRSSRPSARRPIALHRPHPEGDRRSSRRQSEGPGKREAVTAGRPQGQPER